MSGIVQRVCAWGVVATLAPVSIAAAQGSMHPRWTSRFDVGRIVVDAPAAVGREPQSSVSADDGFAALFDLSRDVNERLQVQFGFGVLSIPASAQLQGKSVPLSDARLPEIHFGAVYTFRTGGIVEGYVGPLLTATAKDIVVAPDDPAIAPIALSAAVGPGGQAGIRVRGCSCDAIAIDAHVRWTLLHVPVNGAKIDLNPWMFLIGVAIRH